MASGTFNHVQPYLDYFKDKGFEVHFIALSPSPQRNVILSNAWCGTEKNYNLNIRKWRYFISAFRARKIVKKLKPDIVHAHYATSGGLAALIVKHPKTILTVHGSDVNIAIRSKLWKTLLKLIFFKCQYVNVVSQELEEKVLSLNVPKWKIKNINIGIDFEKFYINRETENIKKNKLKIICNRSFKHIYDHSTLLKSILLLKNSNIPFHLLLLGDGPTKGKMIEFVNRNNLNDEVSFLGIIPNEDQVKLFKECNIYVSCSLSDGTSLSLLEAMAAGLFPIVSNIRANNSFIEHKKNGLLFTVGDWQTLLECFITVFKSNNLIKESIIINQKHVFELGNRKSNMEKIESLYCEMVKN